jgi:LysR family transcriptional regulator AphB
MDLDDLRALVVVVETRSFSAAAQRLGSPRATLRRRIDALEAVTGIPLLDRTASGPLPTEAGLTLVARARDLLLEADAVLRSVRGLHLGPAGSLTVTLPVGLPPVLLRLAYESIHQQFPELRFEARFATNPLLHELEGVDVVVHWGAEGPTGAWSTVRLVEAREWCVASPSYLAQHGCPVSIDELRTHALLAWMAPGRDPVQWPLIAGGSVEVRPRLVVGDVHMLRHLAAGGVGIALLPDGELPNAEIPPDAVQVVMDDVIGTVTPFCLSYRTAMAEVPRVRAIVDLLRAFTAMI